MNDALKREKKHLADSLADIAHQLRTPLTSANLVLTLMENDPDKGERKKLLRECEELFSQMDWLLTSLLKLSRLDAGIVEFNTEDVDVAGLVEEAVSPLRWNCTISRYKKTCRRISVSQATRDGSLRP